MRRVLIAALAVCVIVPGTFGATTLAQVATQPPSAVKIAAVGDIACKNPPGNNRKVCRYDDVAKGIVRRSYDAFLVLGDVQYEYGLYRDFIALELEAA